MQSKAKAELSAQGMRLDKARRQATESAGLVASLEEELFSLQRSQGTAAQVLMSAPGRLACRQAC